MTSRVFLYKLKPDMMVSREHKLRKWEFRAVQLDLARQMETVDYIREFTDFISGYNYNVLVLYLEGKIRTRSFPYPSEEHSYTVEQMKEVVANAGKKGVEVVPVISTLGHAELFLRHPELAQLAELREGRHGRFSDSEDVFCPSLKQTYGFLEQYLTEIADIFPSQYLHAGCDEVWDMGVCGLCRDRAEGEEGESGIFAKHMTDIHAIISGKLNKKMIMWDDMFELYPAALDVIPRDVIMCCWNYDNLVDLPTAHFLNRYREDTFAKYDKMGFTYIFAPSDGMSRNVRTFSEYAARHNALGGLLTTWEKSNRFLYENYPTIAFAGRLWDHPEAGNAEELFEECIKNIFGIDDPRFLDSIKALKDIKAWPEMTTPKSFLRGPVSELEFERTRLFEVLAGALEGYGGKIKTPLGRDVFEDILIYLKRERVQHKLRVIVPGFYEPYHEGPGRKQKLKSELRRCLTQIQEIARARKEQWERYRKGIVPCHVESFYEEFKNNIARLCDEAEEAGLLTVYYFLPERYSAQKVALFLKYDGERDWQEVDEGVFKPICDGEPFYCISCPVSDTRIPKAVRIETWGYGGQGFTFLKVVSGAGSFVPVSIRNVEGQVSNPENLLVDDLKWCFMGEKDTKRACCNRGLADARHSLEILLASVVFH